MLYYLAHEGGPLDGQETMSVRPYSSTRDDAGHVYESILPEIDCLEWRGDEERTIRLKYVGVLTKEQWEFRLNNRPQGESDGGK